MYILIKTHVQTKQVYIRIVGLTHFKLIKKYYLKELYYISRGIEVSHPIFSVSFSQVFLYPVLHTQCLWGSDNLFQLISGQFFIFFSQVVNIYSF